MATVTPLENGVHSLATGLEAFQRFHQSPDDRFALKDAILRSHHAVETISKAVLYDQNPILILRGDTKVERFLQLIEQFIEGKSDVPPGTVPLPMLDSEPGAAPGAEAS